MRDVLARPVVSVYLEPNRPVYAAVAVMDIVVLDIALKNEEGNPVDLTGCSVVVAAQDREKTVLYTGNIVEPLTGAVRAKVQPDIVGRYALSARVCTDGTEDVTFFLGAMSVATEDPDAGPANSVRSLTQEMLDAKTQVTSGIGTINSLIDTTTTAVNNANAASSAATEAANTANTAANTANTAANAANASASSAQNAADSANTAANTAAEYTQALGDIDTLVAGKVQAAQTAAADAASSAGQATASANAAAASQQSAAQSASSAASSASAANESQTAATGSAAAALASQNAAQTAEGNATASADAAAASQQSAAQSAQAAATSATNAANVVTAGNAIDITDGAGGTRVVSVNASTTAKAGAVPMADTSGLPSPTWGCLPPGWIGFFAAAAAPDGFLICNGAQNLSRVAYGRLFGAIGTLYGDGDGSTTFGIPDLRGRFAQGDTSIGVSKNAGLPNITGAVHNAVWGGTYDTSGCFSVVSYDTRNGLDTTIQDGKTGYLYLFFNASKSNAIFGGSDTVQPPAVTLLPCIKY